MNSAPRRDSIGFSSSSQNGSEDGSEFERIMNNNAYASIIGSVPVSRMPEDCHLNPGCSTSTAKISPPTSSSSLVMQHLQHQPQQHSQSFFPSMQLSHVSNGGAVGEAATAGATALAMLFDGQTLSSHQGGQGELMHNFHDVFASTASPTPTGVPSSSATVPINSSDNDITLETLASNNGNSNATTPANRPKMFHGKGSFPLNLTLMLESVESMNLSCVVSWVPDGKSFVIHNPDQFLNVVLPKFFKSSKNTKLRSFYRKLNRWGFSILRNHHLTKQGVGTMKGVWNHPDFFRSKAVECLKVALETGDTSSVLTDAHGKAEGFTKSETASPSSGGAVAASVGSGVGGEEVQLHGGDGGSLACKKRRGSSPFSQRDSFSQRASFSLRDSFSRRDSITTVSTELPQSYFSGGHHQHRASRRESDFSLGDDSTTLDVSANNMTQHLEDKFMLALVARQSAGSMTHQPMAAAAYGDRFNLASSFSGGTLLPAMQANADHFNLASSFSCGNPLPAMQATAAASLMNQRGQGSVNYGSNTYQPITQSGATVGNNSGRHQGVSASWTAGSTFSQHNFNFPSAPFPFHNNNALMQEGQYQNLMLDNNDNVDRMEELTSMGYPEQNQHPKQGEGQEEEQEKLTPEDMELANFFEKFAESLQK